MASMPTPEELDKQLDEFVEKLVEDKDQLPKGELDDAFWKVRSIHPCSSHLLSIYPLGSRTTSILSQGNA